MPPKRRSRGAKSNTVLPPDSIHASNPAPRSMPSFRGRRISRPSPIVRSKRTAPPKPVTKPKRQPPRDPVSSLKRDEAIGAANISKCMIVPSKCQPIRFPNISDLRLGSVPIKEKYNVSLIGKYNSTYDAGNYYTGMCLLMDYSAPVYVVSAIGNGGAITWASNGNPQSYTQITTNAALLRTNAISAKWFDFNTVLNRGGRCFVLQYQSLDVSGVTFPPAVSTIVSNALTKVFPAQLPKGSEFSVSKQTLAQLDWYFPTSDTNDQQANMLVFLFIMPYANNLVQLESEVTMHYEMVPESSAEVMFDPRATNVSSSALATTQAAISRTTAGGNRGTPGQLVDSMIDTGKAIWDMASPLVSGITGFLGSIFGRDRLIMLDAYHKYAEAVHVFHVSHTDLLPASLYKRTLRAIWGVHKLPHGGLSDPETDPLVLAIRNHILTAIGPSLHPKAHYHLTKLLRRTFITTYSIDEATLINPWSINNNVLLCVSNTVATLGSPVDTVYPIVNLSGFAYVTNASPPILIFNVAGTQYTTPLINDGYRTTYDSIGSRELDEDGLSPRSSFDYLERKE